MPVPEVQHVAITCEPDGHLQVMQFILDDHHGLVQVATPEVIDATIKKAGIPAKSWRFVKLADLPASREHRNKWRDDGKMIKVQG